MHAAPPLVVLSPHPDDAALSAAGTLLAWPGRRVVVSVFTGDPPGRLPLAAARLHARSGLGDDAAAVRREEDRRACALLGAEPVHLGLPDAVYRSDTGVFERDAEDEAAVTPAVTAAVETTLAGLEDPVVVAPRGTGLHRDHLIVRRVAGERAEFYEDNPYAWWGYPAGPPPPPEYARHAVPLSPECSERKLTALAAYGSQTRMLWGEGWRGAVEAEHARESGRPVEHVWRPGRAAPA